MSTMFCYQCEQTAKGTGCTSFGTCGKDPETAALQDLLIHAVKGISMYAHRARSIGVRNSATDAFVVRALFSTLTNVNFDPARFQDYLHEAERVRDRIRNFYIDACAKTNKTPEELDGPASWTPAENLDGLVEQGIEAGILKRIDVLGSDAAGLQELLTYGIKGVAAYAVHAQDLDEEDDDVFGFIHEALDFLTRTDVTADDLVAMNLRCGEANLKVMKLLDEAHTKRFGHPEPTQVRVEPVKGKAILVSGHDLLDLEALLKQTEGAGINIYTHGEMLPAHGYPGLKKYPHLAGNYGGAWQDQQKEFDEFPGAILMTTNCIQKPKESYINRIFTTSVVGWPGATHIANRNFKPVIDAALAEEGFLLDGQDKTITVGFGHNAVMGVAGTVIDAVKNGDIRHFFLVGGCDGAKSGRNYYTDFAAAVPEDCVILTLACGKYRFNKMDFGDIGGIPRLLDVGQCNDAWSAVAIASALADAFDTDVNGLPLSMVLSWFEQKAVAILLSLLHLGITDIRLGPTLPAFVTPDVLNVLVEKFGIKPIDTVEKDLEAILG